MKILNQLEEKLEQIQNESQISKEKKAGKRKQEKENFKNIVDMEDLLRKVDVKIPKVGELIKGNVITITNNAVYVDLGILGTGLIMGREMKDGLGIVENLKKDDEIEATVIELENDEGYVELSIREAAYEKAWSELKRKMEQKETVGTRILEANRGGLMVEINGIYGFLPVSQLSHEHYPRVEDGDKNKILQLLLKLVGKELNVKVIDVDPEDEKLIVSEKATQEEREKEIIQRFEVGDVVEGVVSGVVDFGAFVKFPPKGRKMEELEEKELLEGLVHISELAWQLIEDPHDIIKTGEKVRCKVIDIDGTRVSLSIRALKDDPWTQIYDKYNVGQVVQGEVTKINPFGAFVQLDDNIHGLAHVSEILSKIKARSLDEILSVNKTYNFKILSIEPDSHRLGLSLLTPEEEKAYEAGELEQPGKEKETEVAADKKEAKKEVKEKKKTTKEKVEKPKTEAKKAAKPKKATKTTTKTKAKPKAKKAVAKKK